MARKVFIVSDPDTAFTARLAKHAIERKQAAGSQMRVEIIGREPLYNGRSLARFTVPELLSFEGEAAVLEPNMFAVRDISPLFELELGNNRLAAIDRNGTWDTSLMYMDASKLGDWNSKEFIQALDRKIVGVESFFNLEIEPDVLALPERWGHHDALFADTRILKVTYGALYPWAPLPEKRRFSLTSSLTSLKEIFGRSGKRTARPHDKNLRMFLLNLARSSYAAGEIDDALIKSEIKAGRMRPDALSVFKE